MMNCQSEDWASSSSRAAWARTGCAAVRRALLGATSQNDCSSGQSRSQVQAVCSLSHMLLVAVGAPGARGQPDGGCAVDVAAGVRSRCRAARPAAGQRAVHVSQEIGSFEPPVTEELGVERCDDDAFAVLRLTGGDVGEQVCEMSA